MVRSDTKKLVACHASNEMAKRQMRALYANEPQKEMDVAEESGWPNYTDSEKTPNVTVNVTYPPTTPVEVWTPEGTDEPWEEYAEFKAVWTTKYVNSLPNSSFLFVEAGEEGKKGKRHLPYKDANGRVDLPHLRNAISRLGQDATGKGWKGFNRAATLSRARGILQRQRKVKDADGLIERVVDTIKGWINADVELPEDPEPLTLWKEDDGTTRFLAVFSNNYRDDDTPPEILSADAHRDFVKAVDAGDWPHPELWVWHVKGTRYGQTDLLAYDEATGMTIALGVIDEGMEHIAHKCAEAGDVMSHGMPASEVRRSEDDPSIIVRYRSHEISTLPLDAAANKRTLFNLIGKEVESVKIPDEKVEGLAARGVDVNALSAQLEDEKGQAEEEGRDSKEVVETTPVEPVEDVPVVDAAETKEEVAAPPEETVPQAEAPVFDPSAFAAEVGKVMSDALAPINERLTAMDGELKELREQQKTETEERKATDETLEAMTPAASSLGGLIRSIVIGDEETRVDGRTKEALDGPAETEAPVAAVTGIDFLDKMRAGKDWRESFDVKQ